MTGVDVKGYVDMQKCPLKDYLIKPFNDLLKQIIVDETKFLNTLHLAIGVTGQGKTLAVTMNHLQKLLVDADRQIVFYTVPNSEILEKDRFEEAVEELQKILPTGQNVKFVTKPLEAIKQLKKGNKVVFATTHQGWVVKNSKYGAVLFDMILDEDIKVAVIVDEAHTWLISHWKNYIKVLGNSGRFYEASLFRKLEQFAQKTPYIFGMTATPNREHRGVIKPIGTMKFKIYNEMAPKELMVWKNAWFRENTFFNTNDPIQVENTLRKMLEGLRDDEKITGVKKTALIQVKPVLSKRAKEGRNRRGESLYHTDLKTTKKIVSDLICDYNIFSRDKCIMAVMDEKTTGGFSANGSSSVEYADEDELMASANDVNDDLRIVFVVNKGKAGMNIHSLGALLSLRDYNNKSDEDGEMTEFPIQTIGRLVRLYAGMLNEKFTELTGYDMKEYLKQNPELVDVIKILNSVKTYLPDTPVWRAALIQMLDGYMTPIEDVPFEELGNNEKFTELTGYDMLYVKTETEDGEPVGRLRVVWKDGEISLESANKIDDSDYDELENVFNIK